MYLKPNCSSKQSDGTLMDPKLSRNGVERVNIKLKRWLLKGKWSQNASTNKFAPGDRGECIAGRIIHVGEEVMNWKGWGKCAVLSMALGSGWGVLIEYCSDAL